MRRVTIALSLAACGDPVEWPDTGDLLDHGPCVADYECPDAQICHGTDMSSPACHIPCGWDRDCPEGWFCGELVGEALGQGVCFERGGR